MNKFKKSLILFLFSVYTLYAQDSEMKTDIGFTRGQNIHLWPLVYRTTNQQYKKLQVLFPFFEAKLTFEGNKKHKHFFPLYYYNSSLSKKDIRIGTLGYPTLYHKKTNFISNQKTLQLLEILPNLSLFKLNSSPTKQNTSLGLFFILSYQKNKELEKKHFVLFPLLWHYKNKKIINNVFFPLFAQTKDSSLKKNKIWIFPFFVIKKESDLRSWFFMPLFAFKNNEYYKRKYIGITPILWHVKSESNYEKYKLNTLFPIVWQERIKRNDYLKHKFVLFPLYYYKNEKDTFTIQARTGINKTDVPIRLGTTHTRNHTLFPIFWLHKTLKTDKDSVTKKERHFGLMPLLAFGKNNYVSYFAFTTLYWSIKKDKGKDKIKFLIPVFWNRKLRNKYDTLDKTIVFPIVFFKNRIYNYNNDYPIYKKDSLNSKIDTIIKHINNKYIYSNKCIFPIYWNYKSSRYKNNKLETTSNYVGVFPLGGLGKRLSKNDTMNYFHISPVFWHLKKNNSARNILFPLIWTKKESTYENTKNTFVLFPVFWKYSQKHKYVGLYNSKTTVLFPIYWDIKNKYKLTNLLFPIYYYSFSKSDSIKSFAFTPLFLHASNKIKSTTILLPLIVYHKNKLTKNYKFLSPIICRFKSENRVQTTVFPLFNRVRSEKYNKTSFLLFFLNHKNIKEYATYFSILGNLYLVNKYQNGDYQKRFLYLVYADCKRNGKEIKSIFPLKYIEKDTLGNYSKSYVFAFYSSMKRKIYQTDYFYKEIKLFWFIRIRSNSSYLRNKGINIDRKLLKKF